MKKFSIHFFLPVAGVALLLVLIVSILSFPYFVKTPQPILNLSKNEWSAIYKLQPKESRDAFKIEVPKDITIQNDANFKGDITYYTHFDTPAECISNINSCTLFISEVGDSAALYINDIEVGNHGSLPPNGRYAKNFPLSIDIPNSVLKEKGTNSLALLVHSFKYVQAGIRKGPAGIFKGSDAHLLNISQITQSIVSPIISAIILFVLAICSTVVLVLSQNSERTIRYFTYFCTASALFLFSFSELPREILPIALAGYLHYFLRILSDCMYFSLIVNLFFSQNTWTKLANLSYGIVLSLYIYIFLMKSHTHSFELSGFDDAYVITRYAAPLVFVPHVLGLIGAFRLKSRLNRAFLCSLFFTTLCFQLNDTLVFHAVIKGQYLIKFYPVLQAFCLGGYIFQGKFAEWIVKRSNNIARIDLSKQLAHDIRSPLAALEMISGSINALEEDKRLIIKSAIHRIRDIANSLLSKKHDPDATKNEGNAVPRPEIISAEPSSLTLLSPLVEALVSEKRLQYQNDSTIEISINDSSESYGLFAHIQNNEFKRLLSNLINNAIEALPDRKGRVNISVHQDTISHSLIIGIEDTGVGIPASRIPQLGFRGSTFDKPEGSGLGLFHAFDRIKNWNGTVEIKSQVGMGTQVILTLPRADAPKWFVEKISLPAGSTVVGFDDDKSIHQIWAKRFETPKCETAFNLQQISNPRELRRYYGANFEELDQALFLMDYELIGTQETGLDLIEELGIQKQSILVTSHYEEPELRSRCEKQGVLLIPKSMSGFVPIEIKNKLSAHANV